MEAIALLLVEVEVVALFAGRGGSSAAGGSGSSVAAWCTAAGGGHKPHYACNNSSTIKVCSIHVTMGNQWRSKHSSYNSTNKKNGQLARKPELC